MRQTELSEFFKVNYSNKRSPLKKRNVKSKFSPKRVPFFVGMKRSLTSSQHSSSSEKASFSQSPKKCRIETAAVEDECFLSQYDFTEDKLLPSENVEPTEFDLETIFAEKKFNVEYGSLITSMSNDVKIMKCTNNKHVERLFNAIVDVFSVPMNCVYFDKIELNIIRRMLTMSDDAQVLLARLLKWKAGWHRIKKISIQLEMEVYEHTIDELTDNGFFQKDIKNEETSVILDLLLVDELKEICKKMKVAHTTGKIKMKEDLLKIDSKKKAMFLGVKTPSEALKKVIDVTVGPCVKISESFWNFIRRIITLLYPIQSADESFTDVFRILNEVYYENRVYPEMPSERFPIFRNRQHLIEFSEAKNILYKITSATMNKDWDTVRELGHLAYNNLTNFFQSETSESKSHLPSHVKRFTAPYVWAKVMWSSIDAFKKDHTEGIKTATKFLRILIDNKGKIQGRIGRWYSELALIEMSHNKNLEASVILTTKALTQERLSLVDTAEMLERARKLASRKTGISNESKELMKKMIEEREETFCFISKHKSTLEQKEITIEATLMEHGIATGPKSVWRLDIGENDIEYMSVEMVAMKHYRINGFTCGIHCEGRLPVTLFSCLFWEEIYTLPVPGAFVCPYQTAPLDLYSSQFLTNRQEKLDEKIDFVNNIDIDSFCDLMHENFVTSKQYMCLTSDNLVEESEDLKSLIKCLGKTAVIGICKLMANNFCQWSAGFPDLIVWNSTQLTCKVVEVKGPGDTLSVKQKLWIKHLLELGVDTEVCHVTPK